MDAGGKDIEPVPARPDEPRIGVDEWVASHEGRREHGTGVTGRVRAELERVPRPAFYLTFGVLAAFLPLVTSSDYIVRVGFDTLLYMLLALGLNIVVGYAGLLDLGYVAFYGFGAYGYAMLASPKFGLHWDTLLIIPVVMIATALLGLLVALPSRRLIGDYLAIVTLFFGQFFVTVFQNGSKISFLGLTRPYDLTGGPNGIPNVDTWDIAGFKINSIPAYYYTALVIFLVMLGCVYLVDTSRTGRAWKSLREDPLAAELMGIPVSRLKLVAFAFGAAIAGLTGTLFAGLNTAVFSADFDVPTLIIVYAILILGGAGSLGGVILGALVVNVSLEVLRTPDHATRIFYLVLVLALLAKVRPWRWLVVVVAGTIGLGYAVHAIVASVWPRGLQGEPAVGGWLGHGLQGWALHPANPRFIGNMAFVALVLVILLLTLLKGWVRWVALVPTLYLASFVWENRLVVEPSITRLILIGVILIVLMNARPQGLLGTSRVEIV
ncbi:MAG: branched-chain amino acid transport system permease protein [Gaiellaceae bacterium]|nr:branched-chain amino acid transport system permease protein [Gaiellaceae bacterium]